MKWGNHQQLTKGTTKNVTVTYSERKSKQQRGDSHRLGDIQTETLGLHHPRGCKHMDPAKMDLKMGSSMPNHSTRFVWFWSPADDQERSGNMEFFTPKELFFYHGICLFDGFWMTEPDMMWISIRFLPSPKCNVGPINDGIPNPIQWSAWKNGHSSSKNPLKPPLSLGIERPAMVDDTATRDGLQLGMGQAIEAPEPEMWVNHPPDPK